MRFFRCFSITRNTRALMRTTNPREAITCLNGIRTISITWVIMGHYIIFFNEMSPTSMRAIYYYSIKMKSNKQLWLTLYASFLWLFNSRPFADLQVFLNNSTINYIKASIFFSFFVPNFDAYVRAVDMVSKVGGPKCWNEQTSKSNN